MLLLLACTAKDADSALLVDTAPQPVDWSMQAVRLADTVSPPGDGLQWSRSIVHLHSPWSHDACDGEGYVDGVFDTSCLDDMRRGLCEAAIDTAWLTDHPAYAALPDWDELISAQDGDELVEQDGRTVGVRFTCDDGSTTLLRPGYEDMLMPVGLEVHVADDAETRDDLLNRADQEAVDAMVAAGGLVLQAHTEERDRETLYERQAVGLSGVEVFNLHAMVDPTNREQYLGLDPIGWVSDAAPFLDPETIAEPDLVFLPIVQDQQVSLDHFDALAATRHTVAVAGTDAHRNSLPSLMADGERIDSYRRMMRWFSNWVVTPGDAPDQLDAALAAGHSYVVFDVFGAPDGLGFEATDEGVLASCVSLARQSPQGSDAPEIGYEILKDGVLWASGCGEAHATDGPGVYRLRVTIVPHHLGDFLPDEQGDWMRAFTWALSNPVVL